MGLTDEEFGRLSFLSFDLLQKRLAAKREHDYVCAGIVSATIANTHRDPEKRPEPWTAMDFVPGYKPEKSVKVLSPEEQIAAFERLLCPPEKEIVRIPI